MKLITKYTLFIVMLIIAASCYDEAGTDILFDQSLVEIQEATTSAGLVVNKAYARLNDGIAKKDSLRVNLVGAQKNSAISVEYAIDATSTAVAGVHYNLISTTSIDIPANSSFGYIYYEVLADNIEPGETWTLKISLASASSGVELNENYKTFTRGIQTLCPFARPNFLGNYSTLEPGYGTYTNVVTADPDVARPNSVLINNFWDFGGVVRYDFSPNSTSPTVTLPTQDVVMGGATYVVSQNGAASYDPCAYSFVVPYRVVLKSSGAVQDTNIHTFTKQVP